MFIELFWGSIPFVGIQKCKTEASVSIVGASQLKAVEGKLLKHRCILNKHKHKHNDSEHHCPTIRVRYYYTIQGDSFGMVPL
jgi:hypothetical protein